MQKAELAELANQFNIWNSALQTGDPEQVANLYADDGILLPTVSNQLRPDHAGKVDYFTSFLQLKPFGTIDDSFVRFLTPERDVGSNSGIYTFALVKEGKPVKVGWAAAALPVCCWAEACASGQQCRKHHVPLALRALFVVHYSKSDTLLPAACSSIVLLMFLPLQVQARYSFIYRKIDGVWKITEHHSSAMPEPVEEPLDEVRGLFDIWNNALQTGDPEQVANLYADDGLLLPTVSNKIRPCHESKVDYFTSFLQLKPYGTIDERNVRFLNPAKTLAANSGIYTFNIVKEGKPASVSEVDASGHKSAAMLMTPCEPACKRRQHCCRLHSLCCWLKRCGLQLLTSASCCPCTRPFACRSRHGTASSTARLAVHGRLLSTTPLPCLSCRLLRLLRRHLQQLPRNR
jgi:uncharacterized protein (TIGR02246 family)